MKRRMLIACLIAISSLKGYAQQPLLPPPPVPAPKEAWQSLPQFQFEPESTPHWYALELENDSVYWANVDIGKIIICLKTGIGKGAINDLALKYGLLATKDTSMYPDIINFYSYRFGGGKERLLRLIKDAKSNPSILYVEPESIIKSDACYPSDPYNYPNAGWMQWANHNTGIDSAWCTVLMGSIGQRIGIIDNACDYTHPDIRVIYGYDFADGDVDVRPDWTGTQTHGTHVTGIAGGKTNNSIGIAGVSNDTVYFAKAVSDGSTLFSNTAIVNAINDMSIRPQVRVINMSFRSLSPSATIHTACDNAYANNKLLIAASGNDTANITGYPANYSSVIAVGATGVNPSIPANVFASAYSNYGAKQEISAPGGNGDGIWDIWSTVPSNSYSYMFGTSMAAPLVAGVASLMFDMMPTLTSVEARTILQQSVYDLGTTGWDMYYGYGMICGWCAVYHAQHFCAIPTGLTSSSITATSAILNWYSATGSVSYNIRYKPTSSATWTYVTSAATSVTLSGLLPATNYEFQVKTVCAADLSGYSSSAYFTTLINCVVPAASSLNATSITTTSASLSWAPVSGAISYNVQYRVGTSGSWSVPHNVAVPPYTATGLLPSTAYQFRVQSVCATTIGSAYSSIYGFTTLTEPSIDHTGIANVNINAVTKIYPNPASSTLYVELLLPNAVNLDISLVDVSGREVAQLFNGTGKSGNNNFSFDRPTVPNGSYFVVVKANSQTIKNQMIVFN